jgi:hypothetical protein
MVVRNVDRVNVVLDTLGPVTGEPVLTRHNRVCHCYAVYLVTSGPYSIEDNTMEAEQQLSMSFYGWIIVAVALMIVALGPGRMFWLGMIMGGHQGV